MVGLIHYHLTNSLFFDIPLLYYANLNLLIISCLSSGETYLSLVTSFFIGFAVILSVILLPIKSPVASALF